MAICFHLWTRSIVVPSIHWLLQGPVAGLTNGIQRRWHHLQTKTAAVYMIEMWRQGPERNLGTASIAETFSNRTHSRIIETTPIIEILLVRATGTTPLAKLMTKGARAMWPGAVRNLRHLIITRISSSKMQVLEILSSWQPCRIVLWPWKLRLRWATKCPLNAIFTIDTTILNCNNRTIIRKRMA